MLLSMRFFNVEMALKQSDPFKKATTLDIQQNTNPFISQVFENPKMHRKWTHSIQSYGITSYQYTQALTDCYLGDISFIELKFTLTQISGSDSYR